MPVSPSSFRPDVACASPDAVVSSVCSTIASHTNHNRIAWPDLHPSYVWVKCVQSNCALDCRPWCMNPPDIWIHRQDIYCDLPCVCLDRGWIWTVSGIYRRWMDGWYVSALPNRVDMGKLVRICCIWTLYWFCSGYFCVVAVVLWIRRTSHICRTAVWGNGSLVHGALGQILWRMIPNNPAVRRDTVKENMNRVNW